MPTRFSSGQIFLHWLAFLLIAAAFISINIKDLFPKSMPAHDYMKLIHFNLGVLVFVVTFIRIIVYHFSAIPPINPAPPRGQMQIAKLMHIILYIVFILLPITGTLTLAYGTKQWWFFGLPVPMLLEANPELKSMIKEIHETIANIGYFLIAFHALAALFHHYFQKDNTLLRMLPAKKVDSLN